ncbi:hypothetical protein BKK79_19215 [Cupriavidus sp. USMAA2-4]|uniref:Molecular chaperone n=1 Tax=Cupriavidus malaysiensis TaxID=367825 RepID=A0ABM6F5L0_9BURK|nr:MULTISPECIES: fimbria/pilus periplasmic chaperone [Cupriavidus]AOY93697.1 hypothetical protein BKK79_19215 [Cupriavidus sp. USMAA2-4]AOZ00026.1 hypothetical protein BKK81_12865 [Cupriavidus sp. USMAHM13]AOZ06639.1 hypothetical protein BKK80_13080 [Cupriavidus malaysiensis]
MAPAMRSILFLLAAGAMALAAPVQASLVLQGTRLVFPGNARDVSLQIQNSGNAPALMQTWIDDGRADLPPDRVTTPFMVTPAVSRVEPDSGAVLRISRLRDDLPQDRESVYWINVVDVPPTPKTTQRDFVLLSFRTRIKLFYRPAPLVTREVSVAGDRLTWTLLPAPAHAGQPPSGRAAQQIEVSNPTPYYVSFSAVEAKVGDKVVDAGGGMVAPFSQLRFDLHDNLPRTAERPAVRYHVITDFGGTHTLEKFLDSPPAVTPSPVAPPPMTPSR